MRWFLGQFHIQWQTPVVLSWWNHFRSPSHQPPSYPQLFAIFSLPHNSRLCFLSFSLYDCWTQKSFLYFSHFTCALTTLFYASCAGQYNFIVAWSPVIFIRRGRWVAKNIVFVQPPAYSFPLNANPRSTLYLEHHYHLHSQTPSPLFCISISQVHITLLLNFSGISNAFSHNIARWKFIRHVILTDENMSTVIFM